MGAADELLDYLFDGGFRDGKESPLRADFARWLQISRRFRPFATTYRDKIRAKLRLVRDEGAMKDLAAELETAALLLRDERFAVEYETYVASKHRGPDFAVAYRTNTPFNVEVRRIRGVALEDQDGDARVGRLMGAMCSKVGQMPPGMVNLLWLVGEREIPEDDLARATSTLRQLAETKVEDYFTRRGFESAADFRRQFQRLSGIVLRNPSGLKVWPNPLARHRVPPEIVLAIERLRA